MTPKNKHVHVSRVKKYCGLLDGEKIPEEVLVLDDCRTAKYEVIDELLDTKKKRANIWILFQ